MLIAISNQVLHYFIGWRMKSLSIAAICFWLFISKYYQFIASLHSQQSTGYVENFLRSCSARSTALVPVLIWSCSGRSSHAWQVKRHCHALFAATSSVSRQQPIVPLPTATTTMWIPSRVSDINEVGWCRLIPKDISIISLIPPPLAGWTSTTIDLSPLSA